jgi:hypothetical protein
MTSIESIYRSEGPMTAAGAHADFLRTLPRELPALTKAIQGLEIHEYMLKGYGVDAPDSRKRESHLRRLEHMLGTLRARDPRPLDQAREPADRLIGVCRHFTLYFVAAMRQQGIPTRARVGFGTYFNPGKFEDHWVGEYWNDAERRWIMVDAQLDAQQREWLKVDFDPLDVPHDRFVIAYDAWNKCRAGEADAGKFGISVVPLHGLWFIAASLIREVASLNGVELLPWDVWGAMPQPNRAISPEELTFFDRLAKLTAAPDEHARELRALFESDERVRPGATVFNDRTQRNEPTDAPPDGVRVA